MLIHTFMVWQTQSVCLEDERKSLLEIKASLLESHDVNPLPTWVDDGGSIRGKSGGECCDWERVTCNKTTGHVTNLSLSDMMGKVDNTEKVVQPCERMWSLNVSLFLRFKELTSLNLSFSCLDNNIVSTGIITYYISLIWILEVDVICFNYHELIAKKLT